MKLEICWVSGTWGFSQRWILCPLVKYCKNRVELVNNFLNSSESK